MARNKDTLQYLSETIFIESLSKEEQSIRIKQAGLFEDFGLDSVASAISNFVKKHVRDDAPGGYIGSLINIMAPGVLFQIHPFLSVVYIVAREMGFDLVSVVKKVIDFIRPKLESGQSVSLSELNSIGDSIVSTANIDYNTLYKTAAVGGSLFRGIMRSVPKTVAFSIIGRIAIWAIKSVLIGAGLIAGAEFISEKVFGPKEPKEVQPTHVPEKEIKEIAPKKEPHGTVKFAPSGRGEEHFKNDQSNFWFVPLIKNNINDTLIAWMEDIYPAFAEIPEYQDIIESSAAFDNAVRKLKRNYNHRTPSMLLMPEGFNTRKEVVDTFFNDVVAKLKIVTD